MLCLHSQSCKLLKFPFHNFTPRHSNNIKGVDLEIYKCETSALEEANQTSCTSGSRQHCTYSRLRRYYIIIIIIISSSSSSTGARGSVFGWGTMLQAGRSRLRIPMKSLDLFFNLTDLSRLITVLELTQPLTEMNTRNLPGEQSAAGA
jgi:hypothetical protein